MIIYKFKYIFILLAKPFGNKVLFINSKIMQTLFLKGLKKIKSYSLDFYAYYRLYAYIKNSNELPYEPQLLVVCNKLFKMILRLYRLINIFNQNHCLDSARQFDKWGLETWASLQAWSRTFSTNPDPQTRFIYLQ